METAILSTNTAVLYNDNFFDSHFYSPAALTDNSVEAQIEVINEEFDILIMCTAQKRGKKDKIIELISFFVEKDEDESEQSLDFADVLVSVPKESDKNDGELLEESITNGHMLYLMKEAKRHNIFCAIMEYVFTDEEYSYYANQYVSKLKPLRQAQLG